MNHLRHAVAYCALVLFAFSGECSTASAAGDTFPFLISYDAPDNVTNVSAWLDAPAGKRGFVRADKNVFATDAGPIRFWGTNFCFEAPFPSHEQAERVAARLARLGINCVRFHHMDNHSIWGDSPNKLTIDPKQLERLDYLIYQLKSHGIYVNINLHVSRWFDVAEGFTDRERRPMFDKGLDQFEPRMIELQKQYARDLLTHVNPYTKTAYTDEPAVAMVEISNEDGLFQQWADRQLDSLPEPYATTYRKLWNAWLRKKYGNTEAIQAAWSAGSTNELGAEMLRNGNFAKPLDDGWNVERDDETGADISLEPDTQTDGGRMVRITVTKRGRAWWNPQLAQSGLKFKKGETYTLTFRLRCDQRRSFNVLCQMAHEPWKHLGLAASIYAGPEWQEYRIPFVVLADDDRGRITFSQFYEGATFELADVSLRPGGIVGLEPGTRVEDDTVAPLRGIVSTSQAGKDFCDFLWDTERGYWLDMYRFLKDDLHVKSLVCGTQIGFGAIHNQAPLDFIDNHAYWQHPEFPHQPWDMRDWYIKDIAMVNSPASTLAYLAMGRVAGKPYTVTEYNHPAPNSYAAEGFPMIASFGAFQDWSGIFSFDYSVARDSEPKQIPGFFEIAGDTAKIAHMPACSAMFLRGDVKADPNPAIFRFSREDERNRLYDTHSGWSLTAQALLDDLQYPALHATALDLSDPNPGDAPQTTGGEGAKALTAGRFVTATGQICWDIAQKDAGYYTVDTARSKLFTGFARGRTFSLGNVTLQIGPTQLDWATISMTVIDGEGFDRPGRFLIAATGVVQNEGTELEQLGDEKVTLRDRWGHAPVLCEGIPAKITLPVAAANVKCYPLDESGNRREPMPVTAEADRAQIDIGPQYKTVWYEVDVQP